jgi:NAD(P)H-hydrate epimerase
VSLAPPTGNAHARNALLRVVDMMEADRATIAAGTPGGTLMANAGAAVTRQILRRWSPRRVLVLCGPGNNGGDGFVVAAELAARQWPVRVALLGDRDALDGDAKVAAARWLGNIEALDGAALDGVDLIVDALFGSGLNRALPAAASRLLGAAAGRIPIAAVDVPSGVHGDSGESLGAVACDLTVTFTRKKPGHVLLPGRELCGEVIVAHIGTTPAVLGSITALAWENHPDLWRGEFPRPAAAGNKYSRGHALLVGGHPMTGAARMAARAAARIGAGLTSIAVPASALDIYAAALTSIMVHPISRAEDFERLLADPRHSALLIGPGAGVNELTRARALAMLGTGRAVVLDADAISVFAERRELLAEAIRGPCVLTPHEGEFRRLFDTAGDKPTRARRAARSSGAVVVLKGADTVIAAPDGRVAINSSAPPTLATAGAGDVLGGMILGLLAQGMSAFAAAAAAVWLHGAAAADFGPGLMAEDLPDLLPAVLRRLDAASA